MRLHTRTIVRDREMVFLGSQSLRTEELDARRELGLIFHDQKIAGKLADVFEEDWTESGKSHEKKAPPPRRVAKKVAKTVAKMVRELAEDDAEVPVDPDELESVVKNAVKEAVAEVVEQATGK
jgi:phosphatidylserine/phosphatidylglycerophosphate/cardiolipin synthase-like enzyme